MTARRSDQSRCLLLVGGMVVAGFLPASRAFAQTQEYINGSVAQQLTGLIQRMDRIDGMINAVLIALVVNFIAQIVNIRSGRGRRERT